MMARLGYKPGKALGAEGNVQARVEPLVLEVREGREGVGMEGERKRKIREEVELGEKRVRVVDEAGYRERVGREREGKRLEGCWWGGMKVLEGLEVGDDDYGEGDGDHEGQGRGEGQKRRMKKKKKKKKRVNLLYRPLVREREEAERERRARYDLLQSLSRDRNYEDPEENDQDRLAFGTEEVDGDKEEDDDDVELEQYLTLEPKERLARVVAELREKWWYCFWCKSKYETEAMEDCPGPEEEDHD